MNYRNYKIDSIVGGLYTGEQKSDTLVIYGKGAPNVPDDGNLTVAPIFIQAGVDVFVPDYIGFGRSGGVFTPMNCINTFLELYTKLTSGTSALETYYGNETYLQYDRILFFGVSFAGAYIPLLPKFNPEIKELGLAYPILDQQAAGSMPPEETNEHFLTAMREHGYQYLYRGIEDSMWDEHLENKDGLSSMDNMEFTKGTKLFIGHGKNDTCINYKKSEIYFDKIKKINEQVTFHTYDGGHDSSTSIPAVKDFLDWIL